MDRPPVSPNKVINRNYNYYNHTTFSPFFSIMVSIFLTIAFAKIFTLFTH